MRKFDSGATRNDDAGKLDYDGFLSEYALEAVDTYTLVERDRAWAAGLFEGEGCIHAKKGGKRQDGSRPPHRPCLEIKLTDEDVLRRFHGIVGTGYINGPYWATKSTKPYWTWAAYNKAAYPALEVILPYLGSRRRQRAWEVFGARDVARTAGIPGDVLERFGEYMQQHRLQADGELRPSDNWKAGIPKEAYMKSLWRHFMSAWKLHKGLKDPETIEDTLCAIIFNAQGYLHELLKEADKNLEVLFCLVLFDTHVSALAGHEAC